MLPILSFFPFPFSSLGQCFLHNVFLLCALWNQLYYRTPFFLHIFASVLFSSNIGGAEIRGAPYVSIFFLFLFSLLLWSLNLDIICYYSIDNRNISIYIDIYIYIGIYRYLDIYSKLGNKALLFFFLLFCLTFIFQLA